MPTAIFRTDLDFPLKTADANEMPPTHAYAEVILHTDSEVNLGTGKNDMR
jgi:hypothetical protein